MEPHVKSNLLFYKVPQVCGIKYPRRPAQFGPGEAGGKPDKVRKTDGVEKAPAPSHAKRQKAARPPTPARGVKRATAPFAGGHKIFPPCIEL